MNLTVVRCCLCYKGGAPFSLDGFLQPPPCRIPFFGIMKVVFPESSNSLGWIAFPVFFNLRRLWETPWRRCFFFTGELQADSFAKKSGWFFRKFSMIFKKDPNVFFECTGCFCKVVISSCLKGTLSPFQRRCFFFTNRWLFRSNRRMLLFLRLLLCLILDTSLFFHAVACLLPVWQWNRQIRRKS